MNGSSEQMALSRCCSDLSQEDPDAVLEGGLCIVVGGSLGALSPRMSGWFELTPHTDPHMLLPLSWMGGKLSRILGIASSYQTPTRGGRSRLSGAAMWLYYPLEGRERQSLL